MKRKIMVIIIAVFSLGAVSYAFWPKTNPMDDIHAKYNLVSVQRMDLSQTVEATGQVYPLEKKDIYSDYEGVIEKIQVKAGDTVKAGDVLLTIQSSTLQEQLDQAKTELKQAQLNLDKAKVQMGTELAINRVSTDNALELESYTHQIGLYKEQVKEAELKVKALTEKNDGLVQGDSLIIRAPFDGQVAWINVKSGDKITPEILLATIIKPDALGVEAEIDQNDIGMLAVGQKAIIIGKDSEQTENGGQVTEIGVQGESDDEVVNFPVRLKVDSSSQGLQPGMSVDITIVTQERADVLAVPASAVTEKDGKYIVNVLRGEKLVPVTVKLGLQEGKFWEVVSGLKSGDQVAVAKPAVLGQGKSNRSPGMGHMGR